ESGIGEVTIEEDGMRISVRSTPDLPAGVPGEAPLAVTEPDQPAANAVTGTVVRVESPMVGTFYRAAQPGAPPFVEVGDVVAAGQRLCILEAMKLMNEVKADVEGVVRAVHAENAEPVEFGQLLFEIEPLAGRPAIGARVSRRRSDGRRRAPRAAPARARRGSRRGGRRARPGSSRRSSAPRPRAPRP